MGHNRTSFRRAHHFYFISPNVLRRFHSVFLFGRYRFGLFLALLFIRSNALRIGQRILRNRFFVTSGNATLRRILRFAGVPPPLDSFRCIRRLKDRPLSFFLRFYDRTFRGDLYRRFGVFFPLARQERVGLRRQRTRVGILAGVPILGFLFRVTINNQSSTCVRLH